MNALPRLFETMYGDSEFLGSVRNPEKPNCRSSSAEIL